jgi:hypothetical protein
MFFIKKKIVALFEVSKTYTGVCVKDVECKNRCKKIAAVPL